MSPSEKTYLQTDECTVTDEALTVGQRRFPFSQIKGIRSVTDAGYRYRSVPFLLAVVFVVWTMSELVNGPETYFDALLPGVLAIIAMLVLRLMSTLQTYTVWLATMSGDVAIYRSTDEGDVAALVSATQQVISHRPLPHVAGWGVGNPVNG